MQNKESSRKRTVFVPLNLCDGMVRSRIVRDSHVKAMHILLGTCNILYYIQAVLFEYSTKLDLANIVHHWNISRFF